MKNLHNKLLVLIMFVISSIVFSQSQKVFSSGDIYWGAYDLSKNDIVGSLEYYAKVTQIKLIDNDYFIYAIDRKGKNFRSKFSKINSNVDNKYIDETGTEYLIESSGNTLYILCLKPLPNINDKVMMYSSLC